MNNLPDTTRARPHETALLSPRDLIPVAVGILVVFVLLEILLRSDVIWKVPMGYLMQTADDRYTRAVWLIHNPPPASATEVIVVGASTAAAVVELPTPEAGQQLLRDELRRQDVLLTSLTVPRACYPEQLTLLQNAFDRGHRPEVVVIFAWPFCLGARNEVGALTANRMPLTSSWLADVAAKSQRFGLRTRAALARFSGLARYQNTVNAWIRLRWEAFLTGSNPFAHLAYTPKPRDTTWDRPWDDDPDRYERLVRLPSILATREQNLEILDALLQAARRHARSVVVVESPWPPPFYEILGGVQDRYREAMQAAAKRAGAEYVDPNARGRLGADLFFDLFHVNYAGTRQYLRMLAADLTRVLPPR